MTDAADHPAHPAPAGTLEVTARGLVDAEVAERVAAGQVNDVPARSSRTVGEIVRANLFTRINAIIGVLFVMVLSVGPIQDALFGGVIIANTLIGMIQELRAKQTLDRLAVIGEARPRVRRDGVATEMAPSGIVLDDVIELGQGDKVVVDGVVVESDGLEIDESLLTGEADPVLKAPGDGVMSGSFVGRRWRRLPGDEGRTRSLRRTARRGGEPLHPGQLGTAQRHQHDPASSSPTRSSRPESR